MITARSPFGVPRPRAFRGPLHIVWLALLVLGLAFAHGVNSESAAHHLASAVPSSSAVPHSAAPATGTGTAGLPGPEVPHAATASHDPTAPHQDTAPYDAHALMAAHSDGSVHPAERCMPGQPQLSGGTGTPAPEAVTARSGRDRTTGTAPPARLPDGATVSAHAPVTGVLRI
ncbi:hypothetical protein ABT354_06570 [Streptomyces sp. NPDC000594]|uniref:hypothetical protein n=1 Tax=Streptomyces sp. NPDC000594 TaxID=3154261 RepID=UPI00331C738B